MELKLEVVLSSSIKRKKPWPRFCWLGKEKESVFLLDDKRISEINMVSGRTKKKTPKLHPLLHSVLTMASSHNGMWLCGLLVSGELFLWNKDKDLLKTAAAVPEVVQMITHTQGTYTKYSTATRLSLQVSGNGMRVLLVAITGQVFLWECMDFKDLTGVRDGTVRGQWAHIQPCEDSILPSVQDKEASLHTIFIKTEVMGDACLSSFVFTSGKKLIITCMKIQWEESQKRVDSVGYSVQWATKTYPLSRLTPTCQPVKSRGALVPAFSPDGRLLAVVLNQRQPKATQVLFVSTQNFVTVSSSLGGCGSKNLQIPSKYIRSYWVGSLSWSPGGLFLACVLKRGSLLMLSRLGGLLTLSSSGCSVDFGPAHFLPLHPLVTYRPPQSACNKEASLSSSTLSVRDVLRQRFSVTWHPRLLYLIVSDGYMATVMRVLDKPSPALLLKTLVKDTRRELEKASRVLDKSQIHVRAWLESVSSLDLDSNSEVFHPTLPHGPNTTGSVFSSATDGSALPLFLQDQGTLGGTKELLEKMQTFFEDDSDFDGPPAGSNLEDGGHLEFASMFDTIHALDTQTNTGLITSPDSDKDSVDTGRRTPPLHRELGKIQSKLLTAWAFGMSLESAVEHRALLLKHTLYCVVRYAALLRLVCEGKKNSTDSSCLLNLLKNLLSFLSWDSAHSDGPCCLGLMVELSKRLIHLQLTPHPDSYQTDLYQLSSCSLSLVLLILQLVSDSLDQTYTLQQKTLWSSEKSESQEPQPWSSDVHRVPVLQNEKVQESSSMFQVQTVPQRPSSRLLGVWQWVYGITQQYVEELKSFQGCHGWDEERQESSVIMSQIQKALQATGERLEEGPALLSYPGEHLFLYGSYIESSNTWRSQICEERKKNCDRSVFQETRLCLALLYSLLSEYQLREAQELGDHMAGLILHRAGYQKDSMAMDLHSEAACAVVQSLGRFMVSYFANQPLYILPPHNVSVLPPLHLPHGFVGRLVPLCQEEVAKAVRQQQLSEVWTVDYAQDLLLLGGLLPETVWLAYHLGDWKTAASLSLAYSSYCTEHFDFTRFRRRELHLPTDLEPQSIFQAELESLLGNTSDSQDDKSLTDLLEGEDWDVLQISVQEILKASVMAGVNVLSSPLSSLLETAKEMCACLPALAPNELYLPSPPLYCPQPSPNTQDPVRTMGYFAEVVTRHQVSGVLQRLLMLLRSARCCRPAAQWYITNLRRGRHILHKIKKKYSCPSAAEEEKTVPEDLMKFVSRSGFFRTNRGPKKDSHLDPDTVQTITCFRELCALCWMLHVRDQLSISCRKYQATRQRVREEQTPNDPEVRSTCVEALLWACRLLPFSCFLNAEEILQDILLSLLSELPPLSLVADTLVKAFPEEEESVRVPLREKYNSLLQRLRQCNVLEMEEEEEDEGNELMMIVIQDKRRQRRKLLGRLKRHLAPPELHLWEKEEEEEDKGSKHGMAMLRQLSLGTTLSTSTLTDCGFPPVCSDGDTADNMSEAISPDISATAKTRSKKAKKKERKHAKKAAVKIDSVIQEESHPGDAKESEQPQPPLVGTWEFELEDEEYLSFLEVFYSYVLGKDTAEGGESGGELPLLKGFSPQLREKELHSLTFDVLTTVQRRQRDPHHSARKHLPLFRAGSCYKPLKQSSTPELQTSSVGSEAQVSRTPVSSLPGLKAGRQKGLFGLRLQSSVPSDREMKGSLLSHENSPNRSAFSKKQPPESFKFGSSTSMEAVTDLQQGLDPKLEADFPELGRLLEWMVRWADRRVLLRHHGKRKRDRGGGGVGGTAEEGVVMRVKASAPAVLTSLSLLQSRFTALLRNDHYTAHIQVPQTQWTVAPVLHPVVDEQLNKESSVDTGYPGSANTPIMGLDPTSHPEELSVGSQTHEPGEVAFQRTPQSHDQEELTFDAQQRLCSPQQLCLDDLDVSPEKEEVHAELSDSPALSTSVANPPSLQPQNSPPGLPAEASAAPSQILPTEDPQMRQRLGEDLYRLVQNINYLSLMEVLGASFSNLQLAQQSSSLTRPNMNSSHPNVPSSFATNFVQEPNAFPVQTTIPLTPQTQAYVPTSASTNLQFSQTPACVSADRPAIHPLGSHHPITRNPASAFNGGGVNDQEMQPLSVQALSPETQFRESRRLIPPSQGLLATSCDVHSAHVLPPRNDLLTQFSGLKLLHLQRSPLPQQSAPHQPQVLHTSNSTKKTIKEKRNVSSSPKKQLIFNHSHNPTPVIPEHNIQTSERSRGHEFSLLPPAFPAHTPAPTQGLRLLHFKSDQHNRAAPSVQTTHLMSMEELTQSVLARQNAEEARLQLLRVNLPPESTRRDAPVLSSNNSIKRSSLITFHGISFLIFSKLRFPVLCSFGDVCRQKRRERARKTEVTFRPNDSIIVTPEPADEPENEKPAASEEIAAGQMYLIDLVRPFDFSLTGQRLLDRATSTAAELHAFASTCKRPPECHDAFTNTEPACPPALVDKAVSVSVSARSPKSQSSGNLQFFNHHLNTEEISHGLDGILDQGGHQFISVLDLEDKSLHQDLPPCLSPEAHTVPSNRPSSPTSAQLHIMATSVLRSAAAADPQPSVTVPEDLLNATPHSDIQEESPSCSHIEPMREPERVILEDVEDPSDSEIFQAIKDQSIRSQKTSSVPPEVWFSSHLSELDAQLAALQNIADYLEMDFSNSRMLVNTIEKLTPALAPDKGNRKNVKKTVRLSVPQEAWAPRLKPSNESSAFAEEEDDQEERAVIHDDSVALTKKPLFRYSASSCDQKAGPSHPYTPPRMKDRMTEASVTSSLFADEDLGQTGLSDTAEILDELVKEGYLSLTDLDWSLPQTAHPPSKEQQQQQQQGGWISQKLGRPEEERRELRIWMRRKQREQLAVYQKHRASLREREHKPFSSSGTAKSADKETSERKSKGENEKFHLLEQYNQRTQEAFSLASDFNAAPPTLFSLSRTGVLSVPLAARSNSAPPLGSTYSVPASDKRSLKSGQAQPNLRPSTSEIHRRLSEDHRRRLGLHRPATSLPRDRLSQVTRRGMISNTKSQSKQQTSGQNKDQHVGRQTGLNRGPPGGTDARRGILRGGTDVNTGELTSDMNRVLDTNLSDRVETELLDEQDDEAGASGLDLDWLDNLSETGSSLSKIDWAAIEKMVAAEEG
ncbi:ciliogenesis and planar polarity effector 1 isoform X1 [Xyrichtys novacula]|uniref:Ciliogenesis and planar polarity effector 1 isoform X1 n=1 Tax=Xyrichtys novacula TaxID=13765 RepID=A0AAV1GAU8_XYRNO|nr:ciliogenesis and planar polarity effector 1 isoform X1 [Xyrichtys novacula]